MDGDARVRVRVWDLPTRLFHWTLVLLVAASVVTGKFDSVLGPSTLEWHKRSGLAILALLAFRVAWGFAGGTHARSQRWQLRCPRSLTVAARWGILPSASLKSSWSSRSWCCSWCWRFRRST